MEMAFFSIDRVISLKLWILIRNRIKFKTLLAKSIKEKYLFKYHQLSKWWKIRLCMQQHYKKYTGPPNLSEQYTIYNLACMHI